MNKSMTLAGEMDIPFDSWEDCNGDGNYLLTSFTVNGMMMHLEAIAVEYPDPDSGCPAAIEPDCDRTLDALYDCGSLEGRPQTTEMNGKEYVVLAHPYC